MPRHSLPLDQFKENIRSWVFDENLSNDEIASRISVRLRKPCTSRTIERRLHDWGFSRRNTIQDTTELRLRIAVLFQLSYSDRNIVRQLVKEGQQISERQVARIRKRIGFVRRMTVWERAEANEQLVVLVREELDKGEIEGYGRNLLQSWFQRKGVSITRFVRTKII
jgi:transposase